jgi:hypothetical protein
MTSTIFVARARGGSPIIERETTAPAQSHKPPSATTTAASPQQSAEDGDAVDIDTRQAAVASPGGVGGSTTSPAAAALAFGHMTDDAGVAGRAPPLEAALRSARSAVSLAGLVRSAFVPGFRSAVDAIDPLAAMELAHNIAGSLQVIDDANEATARVLASPTESRVCRPGETPVEDTQARTPTIGLILRTSSTSSP